MQFYTGMNTNYVIFSTNKPYICSSYHMLIKPQMKQLILLFIFLLNSHLYACINHYSPYGEHVSLGESGELYFRSPLTQREIIAELKAIEAKLLVKYSDSLYSDYGAFLLKLGKYPEALHIFQQLIKTNPNAYQIIQNLGMCGHQCCINKGRKSVGH